LFFPPPPLPKEPCGEEGPRDLSYQQYSPAQQPSPATTEALKELQRFCVYKTEDDGKPRRPPFESAAAAGLKRLDRDCAVISTSAPDPQLTRMSEHLLSQAGMPATPMAISRQRGVRLAFLDTHPNGDGVPEKMATSLHGYTLAHIARHLVCSGVNLESCAAQITTRLALPIRKFDRTSRSLTDIDTGRGGGIGTQGDLATAIFDEVNAWQAARVAPGGNAPEHLVLNLSVGWDPVLSDGLGKKQLEDLRAGAQAVYSALRYASTLDVLVLAASGNRTLCAWCAKGPLLPAAWEDDPAGATAPVVYGVGGVRSNGKKLRNARRRSMPQRTAYGENAVVTTFDQDHTTWLYTGSSVATAVASSIAAVVWDTDPRLSRAQVMDTLYDSGQPMRFRAKFWFGGGSAPASHRVSLCSAVKLACSGSPSCPVTGECPSWNRKNPVFPTWGPQWWVAGACHPWVMPQPPDPPCPPCEI